MTGSRAQHNDTDAAFWQKFTDEFEAIDVGKVDIEDGDIEFRRSQSPVKLDPRRGLDDSIALKP
jgi:hypothetical protein